MAHQLDNLIQLAAKMDRVALNKSHENSGMNSVAWQAIHQTLTHYLERLHSFMGRKRKSLEGDPEFKVVQRGINILNEYLEVDEP